MVRELKISLVLFFIIPACVLASSQRHTEVSIKDKNNNIYELQTTYFLRHGLAKFSYYFVPQSSQSKELRLFEGQTFGDGEACPDQNTDIILEKAVTQRRYEVKDFNDDDSDDIGLYFTEVDCKTGKSTHYEKLLLAIENGFELKETTTEE